MTAQPTVLVNRRSHPPSVRSMSLHRRWVLLGIVEGESNTAIRASLEADALFCPSDAQLDGFRAYHRPRGFKSRSSKAAALYDGLGIRPFVDETHEAKQALVLLRQPRPREMLEAGLIGGLPCRAISQALAVYLKCQASPTAIALFQTMFCDTTAMSRSQLRVEVNHRVRLAVERAAAPDANPALVERAVAEDARSVAASLPATPLSFSAILLAAGLSPGRRELGAFIDQMASLATVRLSECLLRDAWGDERRAEAFVGVLAKLHQLREAVVTPSAELAKKLQTFQLGHDPAPMRTLAQMREAGDAVTVDLGPPLRESHA